MKNFTIFLLVLALALFITNPTHEDLASYVLKSLPASSDPMEVAFTRALVGPMVQAVFDRQDFYLFSVYKADRSMMQLIMGSAAREETYIGVAKIFVKLP